MPCRNETFRRELYAAGALRGPCQHRSCAPASEAGGLRYCYELGVKECERHMVKLAGNLQACQVHGQTCKLGPRCIAHTPSPSDEKIPPRKAAPHSVPIFRSWQTEKQALGDNMFYSALAGTEPKRMPPDVSPDLIEKMNAMADPHSPCRRFSWVFIVSTGRSGSTTLLGMLNQIPHVHIGGEAGGILQLLQYSYEYVARLAEWSRYEVEREGEFGAHYCDPSYAGLRDNVCSWALHMTGDRPSAHIRGFKILNVANVPIAKYFFPGARFILNYKEEVVQAKKAEKAKKAKKAPWREGVEAWTDPSRLRRLMAPNRVFDFPLSHFNVSTFNALLAWLDIKDCYFTRVLHSNANGTYRPESSFGRQGPARCYNPWFPLWSWSVGERADAPKVARVRSKRTPRS